MRPSALRRKLELEIRSNLDLLEEIGGECYAAALARATWQREIYSALRPWHGKLAPVELVAKGGKLVAPEEYRLHVPQRFRAPAGRGQPIDTAVSEIRAAGVGFDGETWDELALWLEANAPSRSAIARAVATERKSCGIEAADRAPEIVRRIEKAQRLLDRLDACDDGRAGCLGRVARRLEANMRRGQAMRRYWREVRRIRIREGV